jgi:oligoendopeptidase F
MSVRINKKTRSFVPEKLQLESWDDIKALFDDLLNRKVSDPEEQEKWLENRSELDAFISEDLAWRYIRFTCDTQNQDYKKRYDFFINEIQPKLSPVSDKLNKQFVSFFHTDQMQDEAYHILYKSVKNSIDLFREENIPLNTEIANEGQKYNSIASKMTIEEEGKEITLQQAQAYLEHADRQVRKRVYNKIVQRRLADAKEIDELYCTLVKLRQKVAENAGFENFRDYKFKALNRFDYSIEDNLAFHDSIRDEIIPLIKRIQEKRKEQLAYDVLKPYDLEAPLPGEVSLTAFESTDELIDKTIQSFNAIGFELGEYLKIMKEGAYLDLDSRKGKAPGGYNYPLSETGIPFIFMNATGRLRDMVTMMHEGGHAIHSFLTRDLPLSYFKHTPSEVAELASMSMELISIDHWKIFFPNTKHYKQAVLKHLEDVLKVLPWVAIIDKFQHWVYTNPEHSVSERDEAWLRISREFSAGVVDFSEEGDYAKKSWQRQLHLFEIPFYYIEYAIAQLGAIAIWKNVKKDKQKGIKNYLEALKLGYTCSIPEIYQTAEIAFDFSRNYLAELASFVQTEIEKIENLAS